MSRGLAAVWNGRNKTYAFKVLKYIKESTQFVGTNAIIHSTVKN
jgi:hypothetical protein